MSDEKYINEKLIETYRLLISEYGKLRSYYTKGMCNKLYMILYQGYNKDDNLFNIMIYEEDIRLYSNILMDFEAKGIDFRPPK
jgi:hypothetical protein